jgi:hypothetical protein
VATPTLTPGFTVLSTCDANTGWSAGTVDTEVVKQGTASLSGILRTTGLNTRTYTTTTFDSTGQHLRMWLNYASIGFLQTQANGGIRLFAQDTGGAIGYWYLGGIDTYDGGWVLLQVDMDRAFDANGGADPNRTIINRVGFALNLTGAPRNATNTWYDYLVRGNGLTITGGTSGDPINWDGVATVDAANGYGAVRRVNGVYFVNTNLIIGGTTTTFFEDTNQIVVFENQPVNADLYKIEPQGTGTTTFNLTNTVVKSASTNSRFDLLLNNANLNALTFTGNTVANADSVQFKAGQSVTGCVFQGCNQINPSTATFTGNTVAGYTGTDGALLWPGGTSVANCTFKDNSRAIEVTQAANQTYDALIFENNTFDTHLDNGGTSIDISKNNGSNPTTFTATGGGTVSYVGASVTTRVTAQTATGTRISDAQVYVASAADVVSGLPYNDTVTISNSGTTATVTHTAHGMVTGDKVVIKGASHPANRGVFTITVTGANTYTYTMGSAPGSNPTGTITSTFVYLSGTTDVNGQISMSRVLPTDQAVVGWVRKSSSAPYYKQGPVSGTVTSAGGANFTAVMAPDE